VIELVILSSVVFSARQYSIHA